MARDILIVDDEADIRDLVSGILEDEGYETRAAAESNSALVELTRRCPSLLVLDVWLQGSRMDGLELLDQVKKDNPDLPVVIISGHGTIETAVAAIKKGAYDFVEKPFQADRLILVIERAIEAMRLRRENAELRLRAGGDVELIGASSAIAQLRQVIDKVARTNSRVLVTGPAGCGKELVARLMHARSARTHGPFVCVNAANMLPERLEIELFGVEGRDGEGRKVGLFEQAHGGTLFLDEVADMPLETQAKILRVLVDQTFERVGGSNRVKVDVRVVSATSKSIRNEVENGRFREDLYHRLNVVPIRVPPLSERRDDIPLLVEHFVRRLAVAHGMAYRSVGDDAMAALQIFDWPGNVRQLRNVVERLLILATEDVQAVITADLLPPDVGMQPGGLHGDHNGHVMALPLREAREVFEREYLVAQVARFGGNISRTASFIGMERSALHRKLKSLGLGSALKLVESSP